MFWDFDLCPGRVEVHGVRRCVERSHDLQHHLQRTGPRHLYSHEQQLTGIDICLVCTPGHDAFNSNAEQRWRKNTAMTIISQSISIHFG